MKPLTTKQKYIALLLWAPSNAGWFCLIWNVFDVHGAVGLGTVGYLTALGVHYVGTIVFGAMSFSFWFARRVAGRYDIYA